MSMHFLHTMNNMNNINDTENNDYDDGFAADVVSHWDRLRENDMQAVASLEPEEDKVAAWWDYFDAANEEEAYQNYMNCKYQFECGQDAWTLDEMLCFSKYIDEYEKDNSNKLTKGV